MARKVDREDLKKLIKEGHDDTAWLADHFGVSERTIQRNVKDMDSPNSRRGENGRSYTKEQEERVLVLIADNVPTSWIAEDVGVSHDMIRGIRRRHGIKYTSEISRVYQQIRWQPKLMSLHREFAPKGTR